MLTVVLVVIGLVVLLFGFVIAFGAPFLPTLGKQVAASLELIDLKPGQTLLELGSGDGRLLIAAAKKGINAVGYELNPLLVIYSWVRTRKYRKNIKIIWGNYWTKTWPKADGIFVFLLPRYMKKLDKKIIQEYGQNANPAVSFRDPLGQEAGRLGSSKTANSKAYCGVKLVSFAFTIPDRKPTKEKDSLYLYKY